MIYYRIESSEGFGLPALEAMALMIYYRIESIKIFRGILRRETIFLMIYYRIESSLPVWVCVRVCISMIYYRIERHKPA